MSAVDWDEVKRLAADFQRAQLTSSAQRLSERNCIEIISRLIQEKLLDVVFTTDGKEYITPQHLIKEIKDELFVSGGRINLVDLAKVLSVDLQIISKRAADIEKSDSSVRIVNGQLISNAYVSSLCVEINDKLQSQGQIDIGELTSQYELPSEFILNAVEKQLGRVILGTQDKQDRQIIFTQKFVEKNLAVVRGALLAITRPLPTAALIAVLGLPERIFFSAIDSLAERKELPGVLTGGKQRAGGQYVPYMYTRAQQQWVTDFYNQNGYLEYHSLTRMGISDPQGFAQKTITKDKLVLLPSVAVGPAIQDQIEASVDEAISSNSFVKLLQLLPSVFDEEDAETLLKQALQAKQRSNASVHVFEPAVLVTDQYLRTLQQKYTESVNKLAKEFVHSGEYFRLLTERSQQKSASVADEKPEKVDKKEERRRKAAEGKGGGGAQGRETKTKSTKKKNTRGKQNQEDSDDETSRDNERKGKVEVFSVDNALVGLQGEELITDEDDDELLQQVALYLTPLLNKATLEAAQTIYETTVASAHAGRRRRLQLLQDKMTDLLLNVRMFDKGLRLWDSDQATQVALVKYLLKTVCTNIVNEVLAEVGERENAEMTAEQRTKIINDAPTEMRSVLTSMNKSLLAGSVEEFLTAAETALGPAGADIMVYKHDKKRERGALVQQRELLSEQLKQTTDPALVLHVTSLLSYQAATQSMLHASGKYVPNILAFLKDKLPAQDHDVLKTYCDLVLQYLSNPDRRSELSSALDDLTPQVKEIGLNAHKQSSKVGRNRTSSTNEG